MKISIYLFISFSLLQNILCIENPEDFVNLLAGSFTDGRKFSTGNTLPLVGLPWGFNHWAPQSIDGNRHAGSWWFNGNVHQMTWLRCTHQPSPWIGDWGWFLFGPQISDVPDHNPTNFYEPRAATIKPHVFDAKVAPYGMRIELTPTMHGAILRVTFPTLKSNDNKHKRICFREASWDGSGGDTPNPWITGVARQISVDRMVVSKFGLYIRIEAEASPKPVIEARGDIYCFLYPNDATVVKVRLATSLISHKQATVNLNRELPKSLGYDEIYRNAKKIWNTMLKRVNVVDPGDVTAASSKHLIVFYTGLYRALTFPRRIDEVTEDGKTVHWSPYDKNGGIFEGPLVTDNGFWDTFRTVYPLLTLAYPDYLGDKI
eukprot:gene9663-20092_t